MSKKIIDAITHLSPEEQDRIADLITTLVHISNRYAHKLVAPSFRAHVAHIDETLGVILSRIYEKKYCSLKDLQQWLKKYHLGNDKLIIETCSPATIPENIHKKAHQIHVGEQIGLYAQRGNVIYKRTLTGDLQKMLA